MWFSPKASINVTPSTYFWCASLSQHSFHHLTHQQYLTSTCWHISPLEHTKITHFSHPPHHCCLYLLVQFGDIHQYYNPHGINIQCHAEGASDPPQKNTEKVLRSENH